jgi:hypothetical protein
LGGWWVSWFVVGCVEGVVAVLERWKGFTYSHEGDVLDVVVVGHCCVDLLFLVVGCEAVECFVFFCCFSLKGEL